MTLENNTNHYYHIKSRSKNSGEVSISFNVNPHRLNKVRSFKLKRIIVPYTFYPINSNNNIINIFKSGDSQDRQAVIPPGSYTLTQLKTTLKTILDSLAGPPSVWTITDDANTFKLTLTATVAYIYRGTSTANELLGFLDTDTSSGLSQTGVNIYDISGPNYIEIRSNQLTKYDTRVRTSDFSSDLLELVPTSDYIYGQTIKYEPDDHIFDYHPKAENNIDIKLFNEKNQPLGGATGLNGRELVITLQFQTISTNHPKIYNRSDPRSYRNSGFGNVIN